MSTNKRVVSSIREEGKWIKKGIIEEIIFPLNLERTLDPQQGINNDQERRESLFTHPVTHLTKIDCNHDILDTALVTENIKLK